LESILKSTLKRQLPYLVGGSITGAIITYYYGFLFSIVVNSVAWFVISTVVNKYYWNYTGFKDEMYLISKYITKMQKNKPNSAQKTNNTGYKKDERLNSGDKESSLNSAENSKTKNVGSPLKL
jgi:p-aminobenzoyl-glutamate transporter AbgT